VFCSFSVPFEFVFFSDDTVENEKKMKVVLIKNNK